MTKPTDYDAALAVIKAQKEIIASYRRALIQVLVIADCIDDVRSKIKAALEDES